jgi:hypothetical protein
VRSVKGDLVEAGNGQEGTSAGDITMYSEKGDITITSVQSSGSEGGSVWGNSGGAGGAGGNAGNLQFSLIIGKFEKRLSFRLSDCCCQTSATDFSLPDRNFYLFSHCIQNPFCSVDGDAVILIAFVSGNLRNIYTQPFG